MTPLTESEYSISNGLLFRKGKVCVPKNLNVRKTIPSPSAGYPGIQRTLDLVKKPFYWLKMKKGIESHVLGCTQCRMNKAERMKQSGLCNKEPRIAYFVSILTQVY